MSDDEDQTASLMTPAKLAQLRAMKVKPVVSPAAWLDQMAADAGSGHVRRLVELRQQVENQLRERDYNSVVGAIKGLGQELGKLDFTLVQPKGWLARATGKAREAASEFAAQFGRIERAADDLKDAAKALQRRQQQLNAALDKTLLEFDVEARAIEKIIEQGARWLQDMRNQLKERAAQTPDAAARKLIEEDTARCELLVQRLKKLRAASSAVHHAREQLAATAARRQALQQALQQALDGELANWLRQLAPVAAQARQGAAAGGELAPAQAAQQALQQSLKQIGRDCLQLQEQEETLAGEVVAAREPLQAAA